MVVRLYEKGNENMGVIGALIIMGIIYWIYNNF